MAKHRVRKVTQTFRSADGFHWPVDVLLIVFGGFLLGVSLAFQRFDDPVWYQNAWTSVVVIPVIVATGVMVSRVLSRRWLRRSMQVGMLVSLVVHFLLVLATLHVVLPQKIWERQPLRDVVATPNSRAVSSPLHLELATGQETASNPLPPLETPPPLPENTTAQRIAVDRSPLELQPQPVLDPQVTARPDIVRRSIDAPPQARRRNTPGRWSSQQEQVEPLTRRVEQTAGQPALTQRPDTPQPATTDVARNVRDFSVAAASDAQAATTPMWQGVSALRIVPRAGDLPSAQSPITIPREPKLSPVETSLAVDQPRQVARPSTDTPVLVAAHTPVDRQVSRPRSTGRPQADAIAGSEVAPEMQLRRNSQSDIPVTAQVESPRPDRNVLLVERPRSDLPDAADTVHRASAPATTSSGEAHREAAFVAVARAESPASVVAMATVDERPQPDAARPHRRADSTVDVPLPSAPRVPPTRSHSAERETGQVVSSPAVPRVSSSPVDSTDALRPTDTTVARQAHVGHELASRQSAETEQASPQQQFANAVFRRAMYAEQATYLPYERPGAEPVRAPRSAPLQTTVDVDSPSTRLGEESLPTAAAAATLALNRGTVGVAGAGYSRNLDRAAPAADSPAWTASGASAWKPVQQREPAEALRPATVGVALRAAAASLRPQTTFVAEPVESPSATTASTVPSPHGPAVASVSLAARADRADHTADQGPLEVDLGPPRIVPQLQFGRGSGGGQPQLSPSPVAAASVPSRPDGSQMTIRTETVAQAVTAPQGESGGRPLAIDRAPAAVSAARTDAGGTAAVTHYLSRATEEGAVREPNAAEMLGALALQNVGTATHAHRSLMDRDARSLASSLSGAALHRSANLPQPLTEHSGDEASRVAEPAVAQVGYTTDADERTGSSVHAGATARVQPPRVEPRAAIAALPSAVAAPELAPYIESGASALTTRHRSLSADAPQGAPLAGGGRVTTLQPARAPQVQLDASGDPAIEQVVWNAAANENDQAVAAATGTAGPQATGGLSLGPSAAIEDVADPIAAVATPSALLLRVGRSRGNEPPAAAPLPGTTQPLHRPSVAPATYQVAATEGARIEPSPTASPPVAAAAFSDARAVPSSVPAVVPVDVNASPGDGGVANLVAQDAGIPDRRARPDDPRVQVQVSRIVPRESGGLPATNLAPVVAAEAFRQRMERHRPGGGDRLGPQTEQAIELGLAFLARHQLADGRWSLQGFDDTPVVMNSDTAATGLALLAFQGAGYTHREYQYRDVVRRGLDFLLASQQREGLLYMESDAESNRVTRLYSHAIATLALCEAYGMTQDAALREPVQRAIDYIVATQSPELGGWRYAPQVSSDTSVSGWMLMALKSGELAGLQIPEETYRLVVRWLDRAQGNEPHLYRYNPDAPDTPAQRHGRVPSPTMTSVGLLMRLYTGWRRDHPAMRAGGDYLRDNLPGMSDLADPVASRRRDTYYWYYATQVMFHLGGEYWQAWNGQLHPLLVQSQIKTGPQAGSWDPVHPVPDRWAAHAGRLYVTTMNLLSLEVPYRYLPLYESTAR